MIETLLQYVGGATFILFVGAIKILVDPILAPQGTVYDFGEAGNSTRMFSPAYQKGDFVNTDLLLLTHPHPDHIDTFGLEAINGNTDACICHKSVYQYISQFEFGTNVILPAGKTISFDLKGYEVKIEAVIAVHALDDEVAKQIGYGNGYYLTVSDKNSKEETRIYITGDTMPKTEVFSQMANKNIDLMIPNVGGALKNMPYGPITLTSKYLVEMMQNLKPKIVCPVHFGEFSHYGDNISEIIALEDPSIIVPERGEQTKLF